MSFGPSGNVKNAESNLATNAGTATNTLFPQALSSGQGLLKQGQGSVASGTNFLDTILNGNGTNTASMLQPSIDQIRSGNQQNIQQASTLMPRGGGRSGSLFSLSTQPQQQIQSLFNGARTSAATALPQIGLGEAGVGTNLFNIGNSALSVGNQASTGLGSLDLQQQQMNNQFAAGLGGGIFNLLSTPLAGTGTQSLFGKLFSPSPS